MKAAVVEKTGDPPVYTDFQQPVPTAGELDISVTAAALSQLTRSRAAGKHYSAKAVFPFIAGVDGVGRLADGRRVYFFKPAAPFGSMAQRAAIPADQCVPIPDDLDDVTAAAIANPGMSSWAALKERAKLALGETVLINGATGTSGKLAIQITRHLGGRKIIATGRDVAVLKSLHALGADVTVPLGSDPQALEGAFIEQFQQGIDVVLDYLWGSTAEKLLIAAAKSDKEDLPIRFVQIGSVSAQEITLPAAALRSIPLLLMGSGLGSVPLPRLVQSIQDLLAVTVRAGFKIATETIPLTNVEKTWANTNPSVRTVYTL